MKHGAIVRVMDSTDIAKAWGGRYGVYLNDMGRLGLIRMTTPYIDFFEDKRIFLREEVYVENICLEEILWTYRV